MMWAFRGRGGARDRLSRIARRSWRSAGYRLFGDPLVNGCEYRSGREKESKDFRVHPCSTSRSIRRSAGAAWATFPAWTGTRRKHTGEPQLPPHVRRDRLTELLDRFRRGEIDEAEVMDRLDSAPTEALSCARLDTHRALRLGHPEAILCRGKTRDQVLEICRAMARRGDGFLATRATPAQLDAIEEALPEVRVSRRGRIAHLPPDVPPDPTVRGTVVIVTAGTADLPAAEEARITALAHGNPVELLPDLGVAGLQRILEARSALGRAAVLIVAAGMDGALPSVVAGLVPVPVIALPTSTGYGAALEGVAPLLTMLSSCAPGVTVVNIDNGYGAASAATRINQFAGSVEDAGAVDD